MRALVFPMDAARGFGYNPCRASVHLEKSLGNGDEVESGSPLEGFGQVLWTAKGKNDRRSKRRARPIQGRQHRPAFESFKIFGRLGRLSGEE
jgi:hypothetical protein